VRAIRASEIGAFLYCRRAWWYRGQGIESANSAELNSGTRLHRQHGQKVLAAGALRLLAFVLVAAALLLAVVELTRLLIP